MNTRFFKKPLFFLYRSPNRIILTCFLILYISVAAAPDGFSSTKAETAIPKLEGPVNDFAHVIPPTFARRIAAVSDILFQKTGVSMVIVTMPDMGGENLKCFANRLYCHWEKEKEGENKGILLLVASKEKKICINAGHTLERIFPDGLTRKMQEQNILPYLKRDQFGEGLLAGTIAIAKIIAYDAGVSLDGKILLEPPVREKSGEKNFLPIILVVVVFLIISKRRAGS